MKILRKNNINFKEISLNDIDEIIETLTKLAFLLIPATLSFLIFILERSTLEGMMTSNSIFQSWNSNKKHWL
jgi:hypothetical protein